MPREMPSLYLITPQHEVVGKILAAPYDADIRALFRKYVVKKRFKPLPLKIS